MHKSLTSKHFTMLSPIMGYVQTDSVDSPFSTHSLRKFYFEEFLADKFVKDDLFKTCLFPVFDFNTGEVRLCYCLQVYFETEQEMSYNESLFFHGHPDKETALKDIVSPSCFIDYEKITDDFFYGAYLLVCYLIGITIMMMLLYTNTNTHTNIRILMNKSH